MHAGRPATIACAAVLQRAGAPQLPKRAAHLALGEPELVTSIFARLRRRSRSVSVLDKRRFKMLTARAGDGGLDAMLLADGLAARVFGARLVGALTDVLQVNSPSLVQSHRRNLGKGQSYANPRSTIPSKSRRPPRPMNSQPKPSSPALAAPVTKKKRNATWYPT